MRFKGLDLNLLMVLDVLIDRRSVTRAAEHLHISQPAISASLARLRLHFNDPLLIQHGKQMIPSAYAQKLQPHLKSLLTDIDVLISTPAAFDPMQSTRTFWLMASDFVLVTVLADLLPTVERLAPGVRFVVMPTNLDAIARMEAGEIDLIITPRDYLSDAHPMVPLMLERHVVAGCANNPLMARPTTVDDLATGSFISVLIGGEQQGSFAITELAKLGITLNHALTTSYFAVVPHMLMGTNHLAILHEAMARKLSRHLPIRYWPLPIEIPAMQMMIQCHRAHAADPAIVWLIAQLQALAATNSGL